MRLSNLLLYQHLEKRYMNEPELSLSKTLIVYLNTLCNEASERLKNIRRDFPQFTLHDEVHSLKVVNIMGDIIPIEVLNILNPIEIFFLILSAYFHDQGMAIDDKEYSEICQSSDYKVSLRLWDSSFPNLSEIKRIINSHKYSEPEKDVMKKLELEFERGHLMSFIRKDHGERAKKYIEVKYKDDPRLNIDGQNYSSLVGLLCKSHTMNILDLNDSNGFRLDEGVQKYEVNMVYLSLILRLADILDFDPDRTPKILFKSIEFNDDISITEWRKHLSVYGRQINSEKIKFTCWCEKPEYEKAVRTFIKWINQELSSSLSIIKKFPSEFSKYYLNLPPKIDDSQIGPKNNAYIYRDLEFSLSYGEILKLFLAKQLYKEKSLCIRELLQNSLDAIKYRKILQEKNGSEWDQGKIKFRHYLDRKGNEILKCGDNGIGMDLNIIQNYLTKLGRSYYTSPEFLEEIATRAITFTPIALFGIGFSSCFMIGDYITIKTRKYYGPSQDLGKPYIIIIKGFNGLITIMEGSADQPVGTIIKIRNRERKILYLLPLDEIKLIPTLQKFALKCDTPIEAKNMINSPENTEVIDHSQFIRGKTILENLISFGKTNFKTRVFEQTFDELNDNLEGSIALSVFIDKSNQISINNGSERLWYKYFGPVIIWNKPNEGEMGLSFRDEKNHQIICQEGILVYGGDIEKGPINKINVGNVTYILNITGSLKGPLSNNRTIPPDFLEHPKWKLILYIIQEACGKLLEKLAIELKDKDPIIFWIYFLIYRLKIYWMDKNEIWKNISLPFMNRDKMELKWYKISELKKMSFKILDDDDEEHQLWTFINEKGEDLCPNNEFYGISEDICQIQSLRSDVKETILYIGELSIEKEEVIVNMRAPNDLKIPKWDDYYNFQNFINFSMDLEDLIMIDSDLININLMGNYINLKNKLTQEFLRIMMKEKPNRIEQYIVELIQCLRSEFTPILIKIDKKVSSAMKLVSYLYREIEMELPEEMKPPYKVWIRNKGFSQISRQMLIKWSETEILEDFTN